MRPVDGEPPVADPLLDLATRTMARIGQQFLQPFSAGHPCTRSPSEILRNNSLWPSPSRASMARSIS